MAGITTHVLDAASGKPGVGMRIDFSRHDGEKFVLIKSVITNHDGRTDQMLLRPEETKVGLYELLFYVDGYYKAGGYSESEPTFIGQVPVRFSVFDTEQHYHVPVLATPWSCTTYRGS